MNKREVDNKFKEISISLAAEDPRTRRILEDMLFMSAEQAVDLTAEVARYYALEPEEMQRVLELHEQRAWEGYE